MSRKASAPMAVTVLSLMGFQATLTVEQIRKWAHRGYVRRVGEDPWGFTLYDLDDVIRHAMKRGMLAPKEANCHAEPERPHA